MPSRKIYIDTSAFYALIDRSDKHHATAKAVWPTLLTNDTVLLTSSDVVAETMNMLQHRLGFEAANLWHKAVLNVVEIYWVDETIHRLAHELWMRLGRLGCSMVDCVGFILMNRLCVDSAFCYKANYDAQGVKSLTIDIDAVP